MFNQFKHKTLLIALLAGLAAAQAAQADTLNFDTIAAGADANTDPVAASLGITFKNAALVLNQDADGIDIPGTEHWAQDPSAVGVPVTVENVALQGYGAAPSGLNALDARWSPIELSFASAQDLVNFSFTLPDSTLGNLSPDVIHFVDSNGLSIPGSDFGFQEGARLHTYTMSSRVQGVSGIVFASGTLYDNISITTVPVPGAVWLFGSAILGFLGLGRRKV